MALNLPRISAVVFASLAISAASVRAEDDKALLARADQAFAAADYQTALAIYEKLKGKIADADQLSAMQERMRFATRQLATQSSTTQPALPDSGPNRQKHTPPAAGEVLKIGIHDLGNFEFDEKNDKSIPDDVRKLSGSKVLIPGQMIPLDQAGRVSRFLLVNDAMSCCYGTAPKLQHVIYVQLPKDKMVQATTERIAVEGTLKVNVRRDDGFVLSIFEIDPTSIKIAQ